MKVKQEDENLESGLTEIQKGFKKLTIAESKASSARIRILHSYHMLYCQRFGIRLSLDNDLREIQKARYSDKDTPEKLESPILTIEGPVKGAVSCTKNLLCFCYYGNRHTPSKEQEYTENIITKQEINKCIVGYPNLGAVRLDKGLS